MIKGIMTQKILNKKNGNKLRITPIRLSDEARGLLERHSSYTGLSFKQTVEDLIVGKDRFNPEIESLIRDYDEKHSCGRIVAIESLIIQVLKFKAGLSSHASGFANEVASDSVKARRG